VRAQTKGGAVRIRIALAPTMAVIVAVPVLLLTLFNGGTAASTRVIRHEAIDQHRVERIDFKVMSYAQARDVAKLVDYYNAVTLAQEESYLHEVAFYQTLEKQNFFKALLQQQAAAAAAAAAAHAQTVDAAAPPAPSVVAQSGGSDATSTNTPDWACIRGHESGNNYAEGGGGAYQFEFSTWHALTGLPSPAQDYPTSVQDSAALELYAQRGWEPWTTRYACGL
jgi:hypothetical protein